MNCPHHHKIFANRLRSYRELPLRLAEYGNVYRFEDSGALSGLLRVRGMCQNDAHIYCTPEQAKAEVLKVIKMHESVYKTLDITNYYMRLSLYDPTDPKGKDKFIDDPAGWEATQKILRETLEENGYKYVEGKGEAAFYGPKIDFQIKTVTGREESASTVQLDFGVAPRLGLVYTGADNKEHHPYIVHRAPMGTHERFAAFMIEHFGGAFPTWLAPVQVRMVPVGERFNEYAHQVRTMLRKHMIRAEVDESADTMGKKIRNGTKEKIPNLLIVGEKEMTDKTVTLRRYGIQEQPTLSLEAFEEWILKQIKTRALK